MYCTESPSFPSYIHTGPLRSSLHHSILTIFTLPSCILHSLPPPISFPIIPLQNHQDLSTSFRLISFRFVSLLSPYSFPFLRFPLVSFHPPPQSQSQSQSFLFFSFTKASPYHEHKIPYLCTSPRPFPPIFSTLCPYFPASSSSSSPALAFPRVLFAMLSYANALPPPFVPSFLRSFVPSLLFFPSFFLRKKEQKKKGKIE